jgi:hypothetical protein
MGKRNEIDYTKIYGKRIKNTKKYKELCEWEWLQILTSD